MLNCGTKPNNLRAKIGFPDDQTLYLGDYEISMTDFLILAHYVLTNTDLSGDDERRQFIKCVSSMQVVEGWNEGNERLQATVHPTNPTV